MVHLTNAVGNKGEQKSWREDTQTPPIVRGLLHVFVLWRRLSVLGRTLLSGIVVSHPCVDRRICVMYVQCFAFVLVSLVWPCLVPKLSSPASLSWVQSVHDSVDIEGTVARKRKGSCVGVFLNCKEQIYWMGISVASLEKASSPSSC